MSKICIQMSSFVTEAQARKKDCIRPGDSIEIKSWLCTGNYCMAWRWFSLETHLDETETRLGYCGLATMPMQGAE